MKTSSQNDFGENPTLIQQVFSDFCSSNGRLPSSRVGEALGVLSMNPLQSQVSKWTKDFRKKGLEFAQFKELVTTASQHSVESNDEVLESLAIFDLDGEGYISVAQLQFLMCQPQQGEETEALKAADFTELLKGLPSQNGQIRYKDLANLINEKL